MKLSKLFNPTLKSGCSSAFPGLRSGITLLDLQLAVLVVLGTLSVLFLMIAIDTPSDILSCNGIRCLECETVRFA